MKACEHSTLEYPGAAELLRQRWGEDDYKFSESDYQIMVGEQVEIKRPEAVIGLLAHSGDLSGAFAAIAQLPNSSARRRYAENLNQVLSGSDTVDGADYYDRTIVDLILDEGYDPRDLSAELEKDGVTDPDKARRDRGELIIAAARAGAAPPGRPRAPAIRRGRGRTGLRLEEQVRLRQRR